jgi:hypothetical protein
MNAEFQWWLLLLGLVVGAVLTYLVIGDFRRGDDEADDLDLAREAEWMSSAVEADGGRLDPAAAEDILRLHRAWLAGAADDSAASTDAPPGPWSPGP